MVWRENRARPLACGVLCYLLGTALMFLAEALRISTAIMFRYAANTVMVLLISTH